MAQMRRNGRVNGKAMIVVAGLVVAVALAVVAALVLPARGGVVIERDAAATTEATTGDVPAATAGAVTPPQVIVVHVDGAVAAPGVYELGEGHARVTDAVAAAGGLVDGADTASVNLAGRVTDGQKVYIPREGEQVAANASSSQGSGDASSSGASATPSGLVNINTASAEELDALPGVGPSTAAAIVEEREANGPFSSADDLMRVSGIGEKKFAKLKDHVCV